MELGSISPEMLILQNTYMENVKSSVEFDTRMMKEIMDVTKDMNVEMLKMIKQPGLGELLDVRV